MPTYEYRCKACGHELEIFQSITEGVKRKCPSCGKSKLERLIGTGAGIIFKGSGFYQTDYRSSAYKEAADADKPKDSKADSAKQDSGKAAKGGDGKEPAAKPKASKAPKTDD